MSFSGRFCELCRQALILVLVMFSRGASGQTGPVPPLGPVHTQQPSMPGSKNAGSKPAANDAGAQGGESKSASGSATKDSASNKSTHLSPLDPSPAPLRTSARPRVGLALGGGGALGLTEIGVLQWFEENHIPVDVIAGTSMGCMISALYSTGQTPAQLKTVMDDRVFGAVFTFSNSYVSRSFRRREDARDLPNGLTIGLKHRVSFRNAVLTDEGLNAFLDRQFLRYDDQVDFNALPIPLRCLSTDLNDGRTATFARGSIPDAVRASVSLPGVFPPFELKGHEFVDGSVLENLPTRTVRSMDADVVLAVSIPLAPAGQGDLNSLLGVLQRSFSVAIEGAEREQRKLADVVVTPDIKGFSATDYLRATDLAQRGYQAAESQRAALLPYALGDGDWQAYLLQRASVSARHGPPGPVLRVRVTAPNQSATLAVQRLFAPLVDQPVDTAKIEDLLGRVRADGRYDADYTVGYESSQQFAARPILLVTVADKKTGPPFLLVGVNVQAQATAVSRATIEGTLVDQDLGSYGAELRTRVKLGYLTSLSSEYFRPLSQFSASERTFFAAPHASLLRQPFSIYRNQVRLSDRQFQAFTIGADVGYTDQRTQEVRVGLDLSHIRWTTKIGNDGLPDYEGNAQRAHLRYSFDNQDSALVPEFGVRLVGEAAYLYRAIGSPDTPSLYGQALVSRRFSLRAPFARIAPEASQGHEVLVLSGEGGTLFNRNVAEPFRFTLGGPLRLSASAIDEYRGTDYFLIEPALLRRVAHLPQPLGQNIYLGVAYEYGRMTSPDRTSINRQDVFLGIVAETPLGAITLAPAVGTNGERKFVFTLGKLF